MDINAIMQVEASEGETYRREIAAIRSTRKVASAPVSSLPQQRYKSKPAWQQMEAFLEADKAKKLLAHDLAYAKKLYEGFKAGGI